MRWLLILVSALEFCRFQAAYAWPPTYGLELNMTSRALDIAWGDRIKKYGNTDQGQTPAADGEHKIASEWVESVKKKCQPDCIVTSKTGKFGFTEWKFTFPSGFAFNVSVDPATVEVQVGPWPLETWKSHQAEIKKHLFDDPQAQGFGYVPSRGQENSAHLNIGARSGFDDDGKRFARYVADYWQYSELGSGLLGEDSYNAPGVWLLSEKQQAAAKQVLESVNENPRMKMLDVASAIQRRVYTQSPRHTDGAEHYQSIGLKYLNDPDRLRGDSNGDMPFELRANRNATSAELAILQLELQEKRMTYLATLSDEPVIFELDIGQTRNKADQVSAFYLYLADMGANSEYDRFSRLLPKRLQGERPMSFFRKKFDWTDPTMLSDLERMAPRARHSASLRGIMREALMDPESARSPRAAAVMKKWSELTTDLKGDPLRVVWLEIAETPHWRVHSLIGELQLRPKGKGGFCRSFLGWLGLQAAP